MRLRGENCFAVLCRLLAVVDTIEDRNRLREEMGTIDWVGVVEEANQYLISAILYRALVDKGLADRLPDDAREYLEMVYRLNRERNTKIVDQTVEAIRWLNQAGIEPLVVKGVHRLLTASTDRMLTDIDLVVRRDDIDRALVILEANGYGVIRHYRPDEHTVADLAHSERIARLDLHRGLIETIQSPKEPTRRSFSLLPIPTIWENVRPLRRHGICFFELTEEMQIIHMALHDQIQDRNHYMGFLHLSHMHDVAEMLHRHWIDWNTVHGYFDSLSIGSVIDSYLVGIGEMFGVYAPPVNWWPRALFQMRLLQAQSDTADKVGNFVGTIGWEMALWRYSSRAARRARIVRAIYDHRFRLWGKFRSIRTEL